MISAHETLELVPIIGVVIEGVTGAVQRRQIWDLRNLNGDALSRQRNARLENLSPRTMEPKKYQRARPVEALGLLLSCSVFLFCRGRRFSDIRISPLVHDAGRVSQQTEFLLASSNLQFVVLFSGDSEAPFQL